jgi:nucleotide-binding universal stress UspA family protein
MVPLPKRIGNANDEFMNPLRVSESVSESVSDPISEPVSNQNLSTNRTLRIAVGCDGSANASASIDAALRLFGPIVECCALVGVVEEQPLHHLSRSALAETLEVEAKRLRHKVSEVTISSAILQGNVAEELMWFAKTHLCNLIVIGTHTPSMSGLLVGNTATQLLRKAQTPVFVGEQLEHNLIASVANSVQLVAPIVTSAAWPI